MSPHWFVLAAWGLVAAGSSTVLYLRLAPQDRIDEIKAKTNAAREEMLAYDGDFSGLWKLVRRTLRLSLAQFGLSLGPAIAASLPALAIFFYLDHANQPSDPTKWLQGWEMCFFASALVFSILFRVMAPRAEAHNG